jgi:tRNA U54 and U55 pseudouridine synthase Pus10
VSENLTNGEYLYERLQAYLWVYDGPEAEVRIRDWKSDPVFWQALQSAASDLAARKLYEEAALCRERFEKIQELEKELASLSGLRYRYYYEVTELRNRIKELEKALPQDPQIQEAEEFRVAFDREMGLHRAARRRVRE